jgi:hypothetical protein
MGEFSEDDQVLWTGEGSTGNLKLDLATVVEVADRTLMIEFIDGETLEVLPSDIEHYEG